MECPRPAAIRGASSQRGDARHERAPVQVDVVGSDIAFRQSAAALDQHLNASCDPVALGRRCLRGCDSRPVYRERHDPMSPRCEVFAGASRPLRRAPRHGRDTTAGDRSGRVPFFFRPLRLASKMRARTMSIRAVPVLCRPGAGRGGLRGFRPRRAATSRRPRIRRRSASPTPSAAPPWRQGTIPPATASASSTLQWRPHIATRTARSTLPTGSSASPRRCSTR